MYPYCVLFSYQHYFPQKPEPCPILAWFQDLAPSHALWRKRQLVLLIRPDKERAGHVFIQGMPGGLLGRERRGRALAHDGGAPEEEAGCLLISQGGVLDKEEPSPGDGDERAAGSCQRR